MTTTRVSLVEGPVWAALEEVDAEDAPSIALDVARILAEDAPKVDSAWPLGDWPGTLPTDETKTTLVGKLVAVILS